MVLPAEAAGAPDPPVEDGLACEFELLAFEQAARAKESARSASR